MDTIKKKIGAKEVGFLSDERTIYTSDFRVIGESMEYKIPAMWKYENLMPWIVESKEVFINDDCHIDYFNENDLITVPKATSPQISVYKRGENIALPRDIESLWVAVPHPDADSFAKKRNLKLNYSYKDFLYRNNKIRQKELLGEMTPSWKRLSKKVEIKELICTENEGFLKKEYGSGGFTIFNLEKESEKKHLMKMVNEDTCNWYFEKKVDGVPCSVQCLRKRDTGKVVVFGFAKQIIEGDKHFKGLNIRPLENLEGDVFDSLCSAIKKTESLLENYEGFFGVDFFIDNSDKVLVLELNIRLTSATIPILLLNEKKINEGVYFEEEREIKKEKENIKLNCDSINKTVDYISL